MDYKQIRKDQLIERLQETESLLKKERERHKKVCETSEHKIRLKEEKCQQIFNSAREAISVINKKGEF